MNISIDLMNTASDRVYSFFRWFLKLEGKDQNDIQLISNTIRSIYNGNFNSELFKVGDQVLIDQDEGLVFMNILKNVMVDSLRGKKWRGVFDGNIQRRTLGIYSEYKFNKTFNLPFIISNEDGGFDGGYDLITRNGKHVDIKTVIRKGTGFRDYYSNNVNSRQLNNKQAAASYFIMLSINKRDVKLEFMGVANKDDIKSGKIGEYKAAGGVFKNDKEVRIVKDGMYDIKNDELLKFKNIKEWDFFLNGIDNNNKLCYNKDVSNKSIFLKKGMV